MRGTERSTKRDTKRDTGEAPAMTSAMAESCVPTLRCALGLALPALDYNARRELFEITASFFDVSHILDITSARLAMDGPDANPKPISVAQLQEALCDTGSDPERTFTFFPFQVSP